MPTYKSPGIYFEEPAASPILVQAAPSDVGAMLGVAEKGPPNRPIRITSLDQFTQAFGGYVSVPYLKHGVRHFFENGGQALWVTRVIGASGTVAATRQLQNSTPTNAILLSAFSVGAHGNLLSTQTTAKNTVVAQLAVTLGAGAVTNAVLSDVRRLYVGATINILNTANLRVVITAIDPVAKTVFFASQAPSAGITASGSTVTLEEFSITVLRNGITKETIPTNGAMSMNVSAGPLYFKNIINNNDPFREIVVTTDNLLAASNTVDNRPVTDATPVLFTTGSDGVAVTATEIVGAAGATPTGLYSYDVVVEASMIAVPGWCDATSQQGLIAYVESRISTKMWAIMSVPSGNTSTGAQTYVQTTAALYSNQASIYWPWVQQIDPSYPGTPPVQSLFPPDGQVMGIASRVSRTFGPQRAPAGTEKGKITNALALERKVQQADTDLLNPIGVNVIRQIDGRGICIMGARTLGTGDFLYNNVRRVFNFLEASIRQSFDVIQFEQNDETTRSRVERGIISFLNTQWRAKLLKGKTAGSAFTVKCNEDNNPASVQNAGQLVCDIGVAVANPAEFVIFRITRDQREAQAELASAGL